MSWREHRTNESVLQEIGLPRELMAQVAKLRLQYFGHVVRESAGNMALTVLEGNIDSRRHRGAPRKKWTDNIREWTGHSYTECKRMAQDRADWRRRVKVWSSCVANPQRRMAA